MLQNTFDLVSFIGAVQGVLIAAFFFAKGRRPAALFLAWYVLLFSAGLLEPFIARAAPGIIQKLGLSLLSTSNFLYGPLLFLFVVFLMQDLRHVKREHFLHFIPFAAVFILDMSLSIVDISPDVYSIFQLIAFESLIVQILTYNFRAIRLLKGVSAASSNGENRSEMKWLRSLLIYITAIYILSFLISHLLIFGWDSARDYYLLVQLAITCMIYLMTYRLILRPEIFIVHDSSIVGEQAKNAKPKYQKSGLKEQQAEMYLQQLLDYMAQHKPYLDPDITIYYLSRQLNITRNHLTQIINEKLNRNFYELINAYRVEEVKRMMLDSRFSHLNLTGIGLEAGFKSKTAFNQNFKKITGYTPSDWKKSQVLQ